MCSFCFSELSGEAAQLATFAADRLLSGFCPSTLRQYQRMWNDFLAFQVAAGLLPSQVTVQLLLSFLECLHQNNMSQTQIANYLTAIRALHIVYGLDTNAFKDERLSLFLKSLKLQAPFKPKLVLSLDIELLRKIVDQCDLLQFPIVFKPLYLVAFFSFMRLSNLLPHSVATFDYTKQLAKGDVIFGHHGAVLVITWSKTMQNRKDFATIPLPDLCGSPLCPVAALRTLFQVFPDDSNSPVFVIPRKSGLVPLTDSVARKHLKDISRALGLQKSLTFHDFRRAGASWAFQHGVPLEHIMKHGTWKSDSVWTYLSSSVSATNPVSLAFQRELLP